MPPNWHGCGATGRSGERDRVLATDGCEVRLKLTRPLSRIEETTCAPYTSFRCSGCGSRRRPGVGRRPDPALNLELAKERDVAASEEVVDPGQGHATREVAKRTTGETLVRHSVTEGTSRNAGYRARRFARATSTKTPTSVPTRPIAPTMLPRSDTTSLISAPTSPLVVPPCKK